MFHVKQFLKSLDISKVCLVLLLFLMPIQTRILFKPEAAYIGWYFNYHLAFFVYLTDLIFFLCFISFFLEFVNSRETLYVSRPLKWLILAFFTWALMSLFHVKHLSLSFYAFVKLGEFVLFMVLLGFTIKKQAFFRLILWIVLISGVFQGLIGIWQFHVQHQIGLSWLGEFIAPTGTPGLSTLDLAGQKVIRAYGTFPHPNVFGGFLLLPLTAGFYLVSSAFAKASADRHETIKRLVLGFFLAVVTLGIFVSFSRIAWAGLVVLYGTSMLFYFKHRLKSALINTGLVLISTILIFSFSYKELIVSRATNESSPRSLSDRVSFDKLGLEIIKEKPILGAGIGNYIPFLVSQKNLQPWQYQPPHNIYLFIWAELGIVGLILFAILLYKIVGFTWNNRIKPETYFLLCLVSVLLLVGMFDHYLITIQQGRLTLFASLGLLLASRNLIHEST